MELFFPNLTLTAYMETRLKKCNNCGQFESGTVFPCKSTGGHNWQETPTRLEWNIEKSMKLEDCNKALVKALGSVWAVCGDSLMGKGITKEYHDTVQTEINEAIKKYSDIEIKF